MQIFHTLAQAVSEQPTVLTIGTFDGIHLGHQRLIRSVVESARAQGWRSALVTFFPPPRVVLGRAQPCYLTTNAEKLIQLEQLGLDLAIIVQFTLATSKISADDFIEQIRTKLTLRELWIGYDFALGHMREGDAASLQTLGHAHGFSVYQLKPVLVNGQPASSRRIRAALHAGDLAQANACLGRPFQLSGVVFSARRYGTSDLTIANLNIEANHALPSDGVYRCRAQVDGRQYEATARVMRVNDSSVGAVEIRLAHFDGCLDGQTWQLDFLETQRMPVSEIPGNAMPVCAVPV